jgi:hypothetical protein
LNAKSGVIDGEVVVRGDWELFAVLKSSVLDQLGVDSSITGVVDILENVSIIFFRFRDQLQTS